MRRFYGVCGRQGIHALFFVFSRTARFKSSAGRLLSLFSGDHYDGGNQEELLKLCFWFGDEVPIV